MMESSELCIPAAAVELDGTAPALGDNVSFQTEGVVTRVAGDKLYIRATAANGQPIAGAAAKAGDGETSEEAAREMGRNYDDEKGEALL